VNVGSVCVLDEPWLELLADRFLLLLLLLLLLLRQQNFSVRPETFLSRGACVLLPEKGRNSTLLLQSDDVLRKIGCQPGKFRVLLFSSLLAPCGFSILFSFRKESGGRSFYQF